MKVCIYTFEPDGTMWNTHLWEGVIPYLPDERATMINLKTKDGNILIPVSNINFIEICRKKK